MFFHLFKYRVRSLLRSKVVMFWSMLFPIMLGTLFYLGFGSSMGSESQFSSIPVALVLDESSAQGAAAAEVMENVEYSSGVRLFIVTRCDMAEAHKMLENEEVSGIIEAADGLKLTVAGSDIDETILKNFTDRYLRTTALYEDVALTNPAAMQEVMQVMNESGDYVREVSIGGEKSETNMQFFYALIAMACLYGSFVGLQNAEEYQANNSPLGARRMVTATNHSRTIIADMLAGFSISFVEVIITWFYLRFVLGLAIGNQPALFILVCFVGSMIGVCLGEFIGSVARGNLNLKVSISLVFSMVCCFFSGLMNADMKYAVEKGAPWFNRINPAALITDCFYCLTVYSDYSRFTLDIVTLAAEALLLLAGSIASMRRAKYVSL